MCKQDANLGIGRTSSTKTYLLSVYIALTSECMAICLNKGWA